MVIKISLQIVMDYINFGIGRISKNSSSIANVQIIQFIPNKCFEIAVRIFDLYFINFLDFDLFRKFLGSIWNLEWLLELIYFDRIVIHHAEHFAVVGIEFNFSYFAVSDWNRTSISSHHPLSLKIENNQAVFWDPTAN